MDEKSGRNLFSSSMFFNRQIFGLIAFIFFNFFSVNNNSFAAISDWQKSESNAAETRLLASYLNDNGSQKIIAGVHFKISDGWKIYGEDSGGIGLPPNFDFSKSQNYSSHKVIWPKSERHQEKIGDETFSYSAYHNEVIIPVEIEIKDKSAVTKIDVAIDFGLCKDICIPAHVNFTAEINQEEDSEALKEIEKFYPKKLTKTEAFQKNPQKNQSEKSFIYYVALALIGGLILNFMPCVLPVLSIKLLSIIDRPDAKTSRIRIAFLATILGIILCFITLAFLTSLIKFSGNELGWGLQFQNAYFLIFLVIITTIFTANLFGKFEFTYEQFLANFLNQKIDEGEKKKNIFVPNFLSGILATILATPCSAPFLGSAISFALVHDFSTIFIIFFFIGVGFAAPYLILLISPNLVRNLPKPGMWMIKLKHLLGILMMATLFWLLFVLSNSLDKSATTLVLVISILIIFAFRIADKILKIIVIGLLFVAATSLPKNFAKKVDAIKADNIEMMWQNFDENKIQTLVKSGKVVLVDVTADWCITCKFNKINVLKSAEIELLIKRGDIIAMRADITKPNPDVMEYMRGYNRYAIPFNIVYGPNAKNGLLAKEILTKTALLKLIEQAK